MKLVVWVAVVGVLYVVNADIPRHRMHTLPGWKDTLPSRLYSGVLPSNTALTHFQHYFFVESEGDPATDPLVVWFQGGPGGPSLFGLFVELGPFRLDDRSFVNMTNGIPNVFYNPMGWQKVANLLFINSPAPVGWSYCTDDCGTLEHPWHDVDFGSENHQFLVNWFAGFPEFASNALYITGESYAGVYVPMVVQAILKDPRGMNLRGFAIGDGCMGTDVGICAAPPPIGGNPGMLWEVDFMRAHEQVPAKLYDRVIDVCGRAALAAGNYSKVPGCDDVLHKMKVAIGGYFVYDLYDTCNGHNDGLPKGFVKSLDSPIAGWRGYKGAVNDYRCGGMRGFLAYTNSTVVRAAMHVESNDTFFSIDNGWPGYQFGERDLRPWYRDVVPNSGLRVLIYSGDVDAAVFTPFTEWWTTQLGYEEIESWRPWTLNGQQEMGGYVTRYRNDFQFVTVRGAGHMVPLTKPESALVMMRHWLGGDLLPKYVPPPSPSQKKS